MRLMPISIKELTVMITSKVVTTLLQPRKSMVVQAMTRSGLEVALA